MAARLRSACLTANHSYFASAGHTLCTVNIYYSEFSTGLDNRETVGASSINELLVALLEGLLHVPLGKIEAHHRGIELLFNYKGKYNIRLYAPAEQRQCEQREDPERQQGASWTRIGNEISTWLKMTAYLLKRVAARCASLRVANILLVVGHSLLGVVDHLQRRLGLAKSGLEGLDDISHLILRFCAVTREWQQGDTETLRTTGGCRANTRKNTR